MKFTILSVLALAIGAQGSAQHYENEGEKINEGFEARDGHGGDEDEPAACVPQALDALMLIQKYGLNTTDPSDMAALGQMMSGALALGTNTQFIVEANDASRTGALILDGVSGDTQWPFGQFKPLITVGEISYCEDSLGMVYVGVPDGMGAYLYDCDTVRLVVQSESYGTISQQESYPWYVNDGTASFTGSHIQYVDFDREGLDEFMLDAAPARRIIKGFGQVATKSFNLKGDPVAARDPSGQTNVGAHFSNTDAVGNFALVTPPTEADWIMQSLCSSHLEEKHQWGAGIGFEDDIYITNEEWITYQDGSEFVGISAHAVNLGTGEDWAFGSVTVTGFEKIVEINPQHSDFVILAVSGYNGAYSGASAELNARNAEYGPRPDGKDYVWTRDIVPARIYIGMKGKMEDGSDAPEDDFLARNGLRYGKLYGFAIDMAPTGPTGGLYRDAFHKPRNNGARVSGKFVAINWQWDGVVKNYRHDGAWEFQLDPPGYEGTQIKWWNANGVDSSGAKTEHLGSDTRPDTTAFVQGSTAGYFGHYYVHTHTIMSDFNSGRLPVSVDATYFVYQGENDIVDQIDLGGAGLLASADVCPGAVDATVNCDRDNSVKRTFEDIDGFEVIAAKDGLYAIIQEDSGNDLGERMFITKLEHDNDGKELSYNFLAQSGGKFNSRIAGGVGVPAGTNAGGNSHEFSGVIDFSGMLTKAESDGERRLGGHEYAICEGNAAGKRAEELKVDINDKLLAVNVQAHNLETGLITAFGADRGGQILAYKPEL